ASAVDRVRDLAALRVNAAIEQPPDPVGEPVLCRGDQQILEHLLRRVLPFAEPPAPRPAVARAEPELEQQLQPLLTRALAPPLVVERLPIVRVGTRLQQ